MIRNPRNLNLILKSHGTQGKGIKKNYSQESSVHMNDQINQKSFDEFNQDKIAKASVDNKYEK